MVDRASVESAIQQYLDLVASSLSSLSPERRARLLDELREHIREALAVRTSGAPATLPDAYAVLSQMAPPESYAERPPEESAEAKPGLRVFVLLLVCSGFQTAGLVAIIAGIPVLGAVGGAAAVIHFLLSWSGLVRVSRWTLRLSGFAALCGVGMILIEVARAVG
jgi:hypothetical protein